MKIIPKRALKIQETERYRGFPENDFFFYQKIEKKMMLTSHFSKNKICQTEGTQPYEINIESFLSNR